MVEIKVFLTFVCLLMVGSVSRSVQNNDGSGWPEHIRFRINNTEIYTLTKQTCNNKILIFA
jgi:hypothetical protein